MDIQELNTLVKVVQAGSFTGAALAMNTQKAHVSRVVSGLESKLGVRLLERSTRSLSLTEVGRDLYERAVGILGAVEEAERAAQATLAEPRGLLKLSCGAEFGQIAAQRWVHGYLARYPQVSVEADFTSRLIDLVHEGFDLAIRVGTLPDSRLAARRLGELRYGLYASPGYLALQGSPQAPGELLQHALLAFNAGSQRQVWMLRRGDEVCPVNTEGRARLRVNSRFAVCDAAVQGLGIGLLPHQVAALPLAQGRLVPVLAGWQPPPVPVHAVFASTRYLAPKVRAFVDHAVASFDADAALHATA